jgi:hypothetical protein
MILTLAALMILAAATLLSLLLWLMLARALTPLRVNLALMLRLRLFSRNLGLAANFNKISILMADKPLKRMTRKVSR